MRKTILKSYLKPFLYVCVGLATIIGGIQFYQICYKNYYLTVVGTIDYVDGLGRQISDFENTVGDKVEMNTTANLRNTTHLSERLRRIVKIKNKKLGYVVLNEFIFPFSFENDESLKRNTFSSKKYKYRNMFNSLPREEQIYIAYTMFEADRIPNFWVYEINRNWDMVVLPDKNLIDVYVNSGVTKPIFVVPLGTNLESHLNAPLKKDASKIFTFANFSYLEDRKNPLKLVEAFHQAFPNNDNVRLLLSPRAAEELDKEKIISYIKENNVRGITIDLGAKDNDYYNFSFSGVDCYVSPSKGEGFSVIPRESMARGIPTIVSDAASQKTLADTGLVKVVHANEPSTGYFTLHKRLVGNFADIKTSDLAEAMLDVYNNYQQYLDYAPQARAWAESGQYKNLKEEYLNMVKPKKIILGDRNEITKDYLMTNSKELYDKWRNLQNKGVLK